MPKKVEAPDVSHETLTDHPDDWVLVRANERLAGGPNGAIEKGEEYWQPSEAAAFMASQGWVSIVGALEVPIVEVDDE